MLSVFIIGAYKECPLATWFSSEPERGEIERILYSKIKGMVSRSVVDFVCCDSGSIVGECEIVRMAHNAGVVGIMVRREYAGRHIGSRMLDAAIDYARRIGMSEFTAEVMDGNAGAVKFFINRGFSPEGHIDTERGGKKHVAAVLRMRIR